ncbi:S8 family peptidase [Bacillus atrophaeus]|uniref:S8 family peptidase n=1 Tax=Bacillus atrophaeus TaxID=1452 RepID=UPI002880AC13|nr:S8 family serine peptidase [Bacillus atrophaeus]MDS9996806.1 S8 family peptidase [Bacillus atrophaeus]
MSIQNFLSNLDPRLQRMVLKNEQLEEEGLHTEAQKENLIPVIAKVTNIGKFQKITGVQKVTEITTAPDRSGQIVTAHIAANALPTVNKSPVVIQLQGAQPVKPLLKDTAREINLPSPQESSGNGGEGVIVGIVDHGCDFTYSSFRNTDGSTRLLALGIQEMMNDRTTSFQVYNSQQINKALGKPDPYKELQYPVDKYTHGTHVTDIAAGNGRNNKASGVATKADIIFVEPAYWDIPRGNLGNFGDSINFIEAVKFIFDQAGNRPCVVNISLGTNGGPHDGTTLVEQAFDGFVTDKPGRAIVIAASNSYADNIHTSGVVAQNGHIDLHWSIPTNDFTLNEVEIWYEGSDTFQIEVIDPQETTVCRVGLGELYHDGQIFASQEKSALNGDNVAMILCDVDREDMSTGKWTIRIHGSNVNNGKFHAWIERDNHTIGIQSIFAASRDNNYTIGSVSCGHKSIVVGSYDAKNLNTPISYFSSAGPTRDGRHKPEISAPGHGVLAAASLTGNGVTGMSGTSMAAPTVAGVVALILSEAKALGVNLDIDQIRTILERTARHNPPSQQGWDSRYGHGRVDAHAAVAAVRAMAEGRQPLPSAVTQEEKEALVRR